MEIEALQMTPVQMSSKMTSTKGTHSNDSKNFGEIFADALKEVNALQKESERQNALLAAGRVEDISQVVVAAQKADITLRLTSQLRNRAVSAYQEIMRMQV